MKIRALAAMAAAVSMLAACGGGGGSPPRVSIPEGVRTTAASSGSDVTAANYASLAAPLARAVMRSASSNSLPAIAAAPDREAALATHAVRSATQARERALGVTTATEFCSFGGSLTVTVNDANDDGEVGPGDSITLALQNCVAESGGAPGNGTMAIVVNAIEINAADEPTAMDVSVTVTGFTEEGWGGMSGGFRMWMRQESPTSTRIRVAYQAATVVDAGTTVVYDFDHYGVFSDFGGAFDLGGGLRIGGHTYSVVGDGVLSYNSGSNPGVGAVALRDAAGDRVVLRARSSTTLDIEFYPAGATTPTASATGVTWASLR